MLCTNTLTSLPDVTDAWREEVQASVELAHAAADGAEVWLSLAATDRTADVLRLRPAVDGVLVETVVDAAYGLQVARAIRSVWDGPLVVSFVPDRDGGFPSPASLPALVEELALTAIGVNCVDAATARTALATVPPGVKRWAKPSAPTVAELLELAAVVDAVGGCCGTTPERLAAFTERLQGRVTVASTS